MLEREGGGCESAIARPAISSSACAAAEAATFVRRGSRMSTSPPPIARTARRPPSRTRSAAPRRRAGDGKRFAFERGDRRDGTRFVELGVMSMLLAELTDQPFFTQGRQLRSALRSTRRADFPAKPTRKYTRSRTAHAESFQVLFDCSVARMR